MQKDIAINQKKIPSILLTSPHSGLFLRKSTFASNYSQPENGTLELLDQIKKKTSFNFASLVQSDVLDYNPNYITPSSLTSNKFLQELEGMIEEVNSLSQSKPALYVDLHQLNELAKFDIQLEFKNGSIKSKNLALSLAKNIPVKELEGATIQLSYARSFETQTLTSYIFEKYKIPSVQIEISKEILQNESERGFLAEYINRGIEEFINF